VLVERRQIEIVTPRGMSCACALALATTQLIGEDYLRIKACAADSTGPARFARAGASLCLYFVVGIQEPHCFQPLDRNVPAQGAESLIVVQQPYDSSTDLRSGCQ
jgi:hypothetical protein